MAKHSKKGLNTSIISILILIAFFTLLIISLVKIINWYINNKQNEEIMKSLENSITIETSNKDEIVEEKYNIDFDTLKETNEDTSAFLKVNGTNVEYIVVKGDDNKYYLNHNFEKEYNTAGWIFADYKNKLDGTDKNIVIYGHNMRDNSMFGSLKNILKKEWYDNEENRYVTFVTEDEQSTYEVFSIYQIEKEDYYIKTDFTDKEFEEYLKIVKERSIKDFNIKITNKDNILTLSTCANNNKYRVVLHAKKVK